jgi:multidrug efflux pump subunit AcrA (membrane-fusion protein)
VIFSSEKNCDAAAAPEQNHHPWPGDCDAAGAQKKPAPKAASVIPGEAGNDAELERDEHDSETVAPTARRFKTSHMIALAVALALMGVTVTVLLTRRTSPESTVTPSLAAYAANPHRVEAPGLVEPVPGLRNLLFDVPGWIKTVRVEEGQNVKAGQLIAELENDDATAGMESARADLAAAQAKQRMTERNVDAEILRAKKEVERLQADFALLKAGPRKEQIDAVAAEVAAADSEFKHAEEEETRYRDPSGKYESWSRQLYDQAHWRAQTLAARLAIVQSHLNELQAGTRAEDLNKADAPGIHAHVPARPGSRASRAGQRARR